MSRRITNFKISKTINHISKSTIFDTMLREININEIPVPLIDVILVQYHDGSSMEILGDELINPQPINKSLTWEKLEQSHTQIKDIKVYISIEKLEKEVNEMVEFYLGKYC